MADSPRPASPADGREEGDGPKADRANDAEDTRPHAEANGAGIGAAVPDTGAGQPAAEENEARGSEAGGTSLGTGGAGGLDKHAQFCDKVGLRAATIPGVPGSLSSAPFLEPVKHGYYYEIYWAYMYHSMQYWFIASVINTLYLTQIIIGATATALGGTGSGPQASAQHSKAITVLTTIVTVIAALLVYFKSRGQPNRVRQLRNELRKVCDYIKFTEIELRDPAFGPTVEAALIEVKRLYDSARANAETNYPDTWSAAPPPR